MPSSARPSADLVYAVFRHGLRLKERLRLGRFNMVQEQAELKQLLHKAMVAAPPDETGQPNEQYLGAGYPVACWLDEIFILDPDSPWKEEWTNNTIEGAMFHGGRDRAWKFWRQAAQAEMRGDVLALEAFYLCMMLGFRGDLRDDPDLLGEWRERLETHLPESRTDAWADMPIEKPIPPPHVPPLTARERLRSLFLVGGLIVAGLIVALAFMATRSIGGR